MGGRRLRGEQPASVRLSHPGREQRISELGAEHGGGKHDDQTRHSACPHDDRLRHGGAPCAGPDASGRPIKIVVPFPAGGPDRSSGPPFATAVRRTRAKRQSKTKWARAARTDRKRSRANRTAPRCRWRHQLQCRTKALYKNLSHDPIKDFAPVAAIATDSNALVIVPSVPASTIEEFRRLCETQSRQGGVRRRARHLSHFVLALFKVRTEIDVIFVPYKAPRPPSPICWAGRFK